MACPGSRTTIAMDLARPGGDKPMLAVFQGSTLLELLPLAKKGWNGRWWYGDSFIIEAPAYLPDAWLNRIKVELDGAGKPHYLWTGWNNGEGHAKVERKGKAIYCHRDIVERVEGRKLTRLDYVDHKCERKPCLNYDCLEVVPPGVNTLRGPGGRQQYKPAAAYADSALSPDTHRERVKTYLEEIREQ